MLIRAVHHIAIICSDYPRSKDFYTRILGFRIIRETFRAERNSYKLDLAIEEGDASQATQIELFSFPDPPDRPSRPEAVGLRHLAFATDDLDASVAHLASFSIPCEHIRTDELTGKRYTFFQDPDGLPLELYEA